MNGASITETEMGSLRQSLAEAEAHIKDLGLALVRESNRREHAEEELECLRMVLNDRQVPTKVDGRPLSIVGRVDAYVAALRERLAAAEETIRPFANIPPVVYSELDNAPLYAAHYWAVVGHPDKSHFTREDLAQARAFLQKQESAK